MLMQYFHRGVDRIEYNFREFLRSNHDKANRKRLTNTNFSVISSNCTGAMLSHALGIRFNSPTVNLFFEPSEYIKFLQRLDYYLSQEIDVDTILSEKMGYPVGICGDIRIHFMHYKSIAEASKKWRQRCQRVNMDNLFVIMVDRDGCSDDLRRKFDALPYENKAFLSCKNHTDISCNVMVSDWAEDTTDGRQTTDLCRYQSGFTGLRLFDLWDYVSFFNKESKHNTINTPL